MKLHTYCILALQEADRCFKPKQYRIKTVEPNGSAWNSKSTAHTAQVARSYLWIKDVMHILEELNTWKAGNFKN